MKVKVNMGMKVKVSTIMSESESITCDKKYKHILHLQYYTQNKSQALISEVYFKAKILISFTCVIFYS